MSEMTLDGVRDDLRRLGYNGYADAIDAHLTAHAQMVEKVREVIPTNWCDPLLTGKDAVIGNPPYTCQDIERLLSALGKRVAAAIGDAK